MAILSSQRECKYGHSVLDSNSHIGQLLSGRLYGANICSSCALQARFARIHGGSVQLAMQKISVVAVVAAVMVAVCGTQSFAQAPFRPPEVTSATDVPYPVFNKYC
jgi:uncharacterized protein (DUF983 family)